MEYFEIALILSIVGGYLLTDPEVANVDGHHTWPASHDFHPRSLESLLLEDSNNSEGMHLRFIYLNKELYLEFKCYCLQSNFYFRHYYGTEKSCLRKYGIWIRAYGKIT